MFSKSKRFTNLADKSPAVGQYDISKTPSHSGAAVLFPKDRRFKESEMVNDGHLLDISNCSTASTKSTASLNNGIFVTPRKPCGKAKSKGTKANQTSPNDEFSYLSAKIVQLQEEIDKLRAENEMLHKLKDGELTEDERQTMKSNLAALTDELGKLRKQIEEEMERNKELVYQQNSYECSLKTMQADLELANTQVAALQQQINSLEQMNADITESGEELENQCSRLHGMNITLQKEKLAFQDRLEEIETSWKNTCVTKEEELTKDRRSLEESVESYKNKVDQLKLEMEQSLKNKMETIDKLKYEKETLVNALEALKEEHEQVRQDTLQLQEVISRREEQSLENLRNCQNLEDQIVVLQRSQVNLETTVEALTKELKLTKTTLEKRKKEYETVNEDLREMRENHDDVCRHRLKLEHDLQVITHDKSIVDKQLSQTQNNLDALRQCEKALQQSEKEQRSTVDILKKKIDALKKENETAETELTQQNRIEIENLQEQLLNIQEENRSVVAAEEKANKLKQEFGRRLLEAQKNLSQKEMELQSYKRDLEKFVEESEGQDSWKRKFEELEAKVSPFQEQLDAFELEKQALLNRNSESQSEIDKLGHQYGRLLGHQNQKQKIRHVQKLIDENASLKTELAKVRGELSKEKFVRRRLDEKVAKATGTRRFDPSLAFKHNDLENKENTPLKKCP